MALVNERANAFTIAQLDVGPSAQVLELGFGPGRGIARLAGLVRPGCVFGIDQSEVMLRQARRRNRGAIRQGHVHLLRASFDPLPFAAACFDRVLAINAIYFWPPRSHILREIDRVTKADARVALYATHRDVMEKWSLSRWGSHRLYDEGDMVALFRDAGFPASRIEVQAFPAGFGVIGICAVAIKGSG